MGDTEISRGTNLIPGHTDRLGMDRSFRGCHTGTTNIIFAGTGQIRQRVAVRYPITGRMVLSKDADHCLIKPAGRHFDRRPHRRLAFGAAFAGMLPAGRGTLDIDQARRTTGTVTVNQGVSQAPPRGISCGSTHVSQSDQTQRRNLALVVNSHQAHGHELFRQWHVSSKVKGTAHKPRVHTIPTIERCVKAEDGAS